MKPFRFALGRLIRVRAVQEELARSEWSAADAQARAAEGLVEMLRAQACAADRELRVHQRRVRLSAAEVLSIHRSIELLHEGLRRTSRRARELRDRADELRGPWRALAAEREGLERLKQRALCEHRREAEREEGRDLDQRASDRAAARMAGRTSSADPTLS